MSEPFIIILVLFIFFCRQYLDAHGLYDRQKLVWKDIEDVIITAACAPPGGGRNPLSPRFVRHFGMLLIPSPGEMTLKHIFKVCRISVSKSLCPYKPLCDTDMCYYMAIHFLNVVILGFCKYLFLYITMTTILETK
jgi:hypothetical protein